MGKVVFHAPPASQIGHNELKYGFDNHFHKHKKINV
jgi:hypothetical protein